MGIFRPTAMRDKLNDIDAELLRKLNIKAILLDVDNTVASYRSHEPIAGAVQWVRKMEEEGFKLLIVSNNYKKRVRPIAKKFSLECISFAMKPLPIGYIRSSRRLGIKHKNCVIIGDQIFTDITGANMCAMKSILLTPIELEKGISYDIRRSLEKPLRKKYKEKECVL